MDVYRPRDTDAVLPVIVSVHGGGWGYGDKERYTDAADDMLLKLF